MARRGAWLGVLVLGMAAAGPASGQIPGRGGPPPPPPTEVNETFKDWRLYCQVWAEPRRVECEVATRLGASSNRNSRLVWLRSTQRWLDGLRFRLDDMAFDVRKPTRVWIDNAVFRPEFPCKPFPFEANTCAVSEPAVNRALVERLLTATKVSAVGTAPGTGQKIEIFFPLNGFRAAVERMEQIRAEAGVKWAER